MASTAIVMSQISFLKGLTKANYKGNSLGKSVWRLRIFLIPILIITVFLLIYSGANNAFGEILTTISNSIKTFWDSIFKNVDAAIVFTYIFCLLISVFLLVRYRNKSIENYDQNSTLNLIRKRKKSEFHFSKLGLKNEYKAGVFLLIILNIMLLSVNFLDIKNIWFGFEWDGETLKEFVHEGTYLLILSILISIAVVLYYFRKNLNFYKNNYLLKTLSYVWIAQNAILTISVVIRNFWYIEYYALAYKRIGVLFFLLATFYGLYTVFIKVKYKKSSFYLFKYNSLSIYLVFVLSSAVPWDIVIAKYNFSHSETSYVELAYLIDFSNKAIPYIDRPLNSLKNIKENQNSNFSEYTDMDVLQYDRRLKSKKESFKIKWERKNWLSWNLAEAMAYKKLF